MDKRLGDVLKSKKWNVVEKVMYRFYSDKNHALSPKWAGPVVITNKASPTVYQIELKGKKK